MGSAKKAPESPGPFTPIDAGHADDFDPWAGWADPNLPTHPMVNEQQLAAELRKVLRYGLPLNVRNAGNALSSLRSVIARSIHPYDPSSRVDALNRLLASLILGEADENSSRALATLFGIAKGTRGTTLDSRRQKAAELLSYDSTHLRKHIEPRLLRELADALYTDLLRYKRRIRRAPLAEEPTGDTPSLTVADLTHQEELISRIWQHVYGLRAELIAVGRMDGHADYVSQLEDHKQAADVELARVRELVQEFKDTYGGEFIRHGEAEYSAEGLERLVAFQ